MKRKIYSIVPKHYFHAATEKKSQLKKMGRIFFLLFLAGILAANFTDRASVNELGVMSRYFMDKFLYVDIQGKEFFLYLFFSRAAVFFGIAILGITFPGMLVANTYLGYLGVSFGFLSVASILNFGIKGILLMGAFLFPQYVMYVPMYILLYAWIWKWKQNKREHGSILYAKGEFLFYMGIFCLLFFVLLCGILAESYCNPWILKKVIQNI